MEKEQKPCIYVVEDRAITRETLIMALTTLGFEVVGQNDDAENAFAEMQELEVDIALLDIDLKGEKNGIWLANQINKFIKIPFVYLTAYSDAKTLREVMETKPHGFLVKPFNEPSVYAALLIALDTYSQQYDGSDPPIETETETDNYRVKDSLFIKDRNLLVRCKIEDICYIKSDGKYLDIYLQNKQHLVRSKMIEFMRYLPGDTFIQVHRRYVVNISKVSAVGKGFLQVIGEDIPVSQNYRDQLNAKLITL